MPAIVLLVPAATHLTHSLWIMGSLSALSFGLIGMALAKGFGRHRRWEPALIAGLAAGFAALELTRTLPRVGMMAASALLATAWMWDHFILRKTVFPNPQGEEHPHASH
jgi:hypothetical protein